MNTRTRPWTTSAAFAAMQMTWTQLLLVLSMGLALLALPKNSDRHTHLSAILMVVGLLLTFKACGQEMDGRNLLRFCLCVLQAFPGLVVTAATAQWLAPDRRYAPEISDALFLWVSAVTGVVWLGLTAANRWRPRPAVLDD
jgi:hypothetical protein